MNKEQLAKEAALEGSPFSVSQQSYEHFFKKGFEAAQPKWISVEDETPPPVKEVLCFTPFGLGVEMLLFDGDNKFYTINTDIERTPTHWMPLPTPPQND